MPAAAKGHQKKEEKKTGGAKVAEAQVGDTKYYPVEYGSWSYAKQGSGLEQPTALILFSGRPRPGDLHRQLVHLGWVVCSVDTAAPLGTDLLDDNVWEKIISDVRLGLFDCVWVATPCGTFSPLRERPPGPRPLRTVDHIQGKPKSELEPFRTQMVKEANILASRSATVCITQADRGKPFGLENPDHEEGKPSLWLMPSIKKILDREDVHEVNFDQCRTGLDTVKPTSWY